MIVRNILIVLLLPLLSFAIQLIIPKRMDKMKVYISTLIMFLSLLLSSTALYQIYESSKMSLMDKLSFALANSALSTFEFNWISLPDLQINFGVLSDSVSVIMLLVVSLISLLVHIFSIEYMKGDKRFSRYYAYLGLFTFSMNGIVLADSITMIYIFWELVGFSSFLLIGFWFEKNSAAMALEFCLNCLTNLGYSYQFVPLFRD